MFAVANNCFAWPPNNRVARAFTRSKAGRFWHSIGFQSVLPVGFGSARVAASQLVWLSSLQAASRFPFVVGHQAAV